MDRSRSLTQLENDDWGAPKHDSYLIKECHRLRHIPVADLTIEHLRMLIGQKISLRYTVPLALEHLNREPLASGDMFGGDLLETVQRVPEEFWGENPGLLRQWKEVKSHAS